MYVQKPTCPNVSQGKGLGPFGKQGIIEPANGDDVVPVFLPRLETGIIGCPILAVGPFPDFLHDLSVGFCDFTGLRFVSHQSKGIKSDRVGI